MIVNEVGATILAHRRLCAYPTTGQWTDRTTAMFLDGYSLTLISYVRAGPAIEGLKRRIHHAPINITNLELIFGYGAVHAPIDALSFGPLLLI